MELLTLTNNLDFSLIAGLGAFLAGLLGALSGLGGGIIVTPLLIFLLGVDIHYAMGASLLAVMATSIGSSFSYVHTGLTNIRAAIFLATATTVGAVCGAFLTSIAPKYLLFIIFGFVLIYSVFQSYFRKSQNREVESSRMASYLRLDGTYLENGEEWEYGVKNVGLGWVVMYIAGLLSGLLGIGSGALKVLALDSIMKFPFRVSTTTSNFMIGLTATASIGIYFFQGYIIPHLVMPVIIGVLIGAFLGSQLLNRIPIKLLRLIFSILVLFIAISMLYKGFFP